MKRALLILIIIAGSAGAIYGGYAIQNQEPKLHGTLIKVGNVLPVSADELKRIKNYKFYIIILDKENAFPKKYSDVIEKIINGKLGGRIERAARGSQLYTHVFGFNNAKNKKIFSVVIISDARGKMIGVYLNKKLHELVEVMINHHPSPINLDLAGTAL